MQPYKTRHLEAIIDFPHGNRYLHAGDKFAASEIDAEYYVKYKKAKEVAEEKKPEAPAPAAPAKAESAAVAPSQPTRKVAQRAPELPALVSAEALPAALPAGNPVGPVTFADLNPKA